MIDEIEKMKDFKEMMETLILRDLIKIVDKKKGIIESGKLRKLLVEAIKDLNKVIKAKMVYEMAKQHIKMEYEDDDVVMFISSLYLVSIDKPTDKEIEFTLKYRGFGVVLGYLANIILNKKLDGYEELRIPSEKQFYIEKWFKTIVKAIA